MLRKKNSHVFAALAWLTCAGPAGAQTPGQGLAVAGSGACPAPERVRQSIFELTSATQRRLPEAARVAVTDRSDTFTVEVRGGSVRGSRAYSDAERDCERRVRIAAVFAVTTLIPPELAASEPAAPPAVTPARPAPPPSPPPVPVPDPAPALRLELGAFGEIGAHFTEPTSLLAWGGELRGAFGRGALAATLGIAYAPRARLTAPAFDADAVRIGAVPGARLHLFEHPFALAADAGLVGQLLRVRGTSVLAPSQDTAFELGFRAGLIAVPRRARGVAPFAGFHAVLVPAPREIAIRPRGVVAHTPLFYGAVTLGVALGL